MAEVEKLSKARLQQQLKTAIRKKEAAKVRQSLYDGFAITGGTAVATAGILGLVEGAAPAVHSLGDNGYITLPVAVAALGAAGGLLAISTTSRQTATAANEARILVGMATGAACLFANQAGADIGAQISEWLEGDEE